MYKEAFKIKISGLTIELQSRFDYTKGRCRDYIADEASDADFSVKASNAEVEAEKRASEQNFPDAYYEDICLYRAIAEKIPTLDRVVFHGAAVEVDGKGYVFTAPSGTGKTTHIGLWLKHFGDKVKIINGDKPILRLDDESVSVCSTPWAGKEGLQRNVEAPISAIVLLRRSSENKIRRLSPGECFAELVRQFYLPREAKAKLKTLEIIDRVLMTLPIYLLECNVSEEAAELSFETLTK